MDKHNGMLLTVEYDSTLERNEGYTRLIQYSKINYCNLSCQQAKEENSFDHINRYRKII